MSVSRLDKACSSEPLLHILLCKFKFIQAVANILIRVGLLLIGVWNLKVEEIQF